MALFKWGRFSDGYEVSGLGDVRFSPLYASLPSGKTIQEAYFDEIKARPIALSENELWNVYLNIWKIWANHNPRLIDELSYHAINNNYTLTDNFATSNINQARALATILNEKCSEEYFSSTNISRETSLWPSLNQRIESVLYAH